MFSPLSLLNAKKAIDYHNIVSATYAPLTKAWSITDKNGVIQSGVFTKENNESEKSGIEGDEEWYKTLDLENRMELIISPDFLSKRCSENKKERYEGVEWHLLIQHFDGFHKICELYDDRFKIEL